MWAWFAPPEWRPRAMGGSVVVPEIDRANYAKFETPSSRAIDVYVAASFVVAAIATALLLYYAEGLGWPVVALFATTLLAMTRGWGALMEAKRWAVWFDATRSLVTIALAVALAWRGCLSWRVSEALIGASVLLLVWGLSARGSQSNPSMAATARAAE